MKLFLVGLPGSGKSTLGKQLADRLSLPFIDLDDVIETDAELSVREVFSQRGEGYFRELEKNALRKTIANNSSLVMATGGGAPCFFDNMELMNQSGTTIFVDTSVEVITERMKEEGVAVRPLLHELDTDNFADAFYRKFAHRLPFYQQAKITVTAENSLNTIIDQLKS